MTPTQAREIITKACQVANPKLLELTFGCEIVGPFGKAMILSKCREALEGEKKFIGQRYNVIRGRTASTYAAIAIKEILGHQPTLADVLLAMNQEMELHHEPNHLWFRIKNPLYEKPWGIWNLSLPFSEQSDPTVLFIAEMLK